MNRGRVLLAALVAFLALTATACGGDDEPSASGADAWAESFCTAVTSWTDELQRIGDTLGDPSSINVDALTQASEDVNEATETFVDDVRDLGKPDTESGQQVEDALDSLADTLEQEKGDIQQAVDDASGLTGAAAALSAVGTSLSAMGTAFQQTFQAIEDADSQNELQTAFEQADACDDLND